MNTTSISEFERSKPTLTFKKLRILEKLIKEEQEKTEALYANRIATLDKMLNEIKLIIESFKKGE